MFYRNALFVACALSPALSFGSDGVIRISGMLYDPTCAVQVDPSSGARLASCTARVISTATVAQSTQVLSGADMSQRDISRSSAPTGQSTQWEVIQVTYR